MSIIHKKTGKHYNTRDYFKQYLSDPSWLITRNKWDKAQLNVDEALFTLGNGFMGSRGILEEVPADSDPGTYFSGVYDSVGAQVTELVNAPNPINFKVIVAGEKVGVDTMDLLNHYRTLDMKQGTLLRRTLYKSTNAGRLDYQSLRFLSMHDIGLGVMRIYFTPLDKAVDISVESALEISVTNKGLLTEGEKKHFNISEFAKHGSVNYTCVKTFEKETYIAYADALKCVTRDRIKSIPHRVFKMRLKKNQTACFTKYFSFATSKDIHPKKLKSRTIAILRNSARKRFDDIISDNKKAWERKWGVSDIIIDGDPDAQRALRFNIYHMLICGGEDKGYSSIGARTMSGEGYRGHIFWDTEIFLLPFFIYNYPSIARSILLYRYNRIGAAREIAREKGYNGTLYPWESADSGNESTPTWVKDANGDIIKITTSLREHHIVADVAYGVHTYIKAADDINFALRYGLEMILEGACFWVSRVVYDKNRGCYCVNNVIGPDEFHEDVDNNSYTNSMAKWNIETALSYIKSLKKKNPGRVRSLLIKLDLSSSELNRWKRICARLTNTYPAEDRVIEEFDNFFKKKRIPIKSTYARLSMPVPKFDVEDYGKTQFVKQADVIMLLYILSDRFTLQTKKLNYNYYIKRTLHKSSLSPSVHSIAGTEVGDRLRAYHYFLISIYTDLMNIHRNTSEGMHAACLGGTWQAVVNGFAGMRTIKSVLHFEPKLPTHWNSLSFFIKWKKRDLKISINRKNIEFCFISKVKSEKILLSVFGSLEVLKANQPRLFKRREEAMKAKDVMNKKVVVLKDNFPVGKVAQLLVRKRLSGAPVVDKDGCPVGFLSEMDMMKAACDIKNFTKKKAGDIMTRRLHSVDPEMPVEKIISVFNKKPYRFIPVIKKKKVLGIVSRKDIIDRIMGQYY